MPFRQELIDAALERTVGLMTSWDLYRLVRNFQKLDWHPEDVKPVLYRIGRIEPVPEHYSYIGKIAKAWTDKFGVVIESADVQIGDRVAVEFPIEFEEIEVTSIRVNDKAVQSAGSGQPAGLVWSATKSKLREGMRVFRIRSTSKSGVTGHSE